MFCWIRRKQWQRGSLCKRDAFVAPTLTAYCHITVVAADFHQGAFFHYVAVAVDSGIYYSFISAVACGFDFVDSVCYFKKALDRKSVV